MPESIKRPQTGAESTSQESYVREFYRIQEEKSYLQKSFQVSKKRIMEKIRNFNKLIDFDFNNLEENTQDKQEILYP